MLHINKEIVSFYDVPEISEQSLKTILLVRHSYRKSLQNGNHDAELTPEGVEYAEASGQLLRGLKDVCYGSSERIRAMQTVKALKEGGSLEEGDITVYPEIRDTVVFSDPRGLGIAIQQGNIPQLVRSYFSTGKADAMLDLSVNHERLLNFLTQTQFEKKNVILATHDIIVATLLIPLKVYPFHPEDWCGYVQGALLNQSPDGSWNISYVVPDKKKREKILFFV